ncbi:MAG: carboxypeptidase-like regulatory domain-containing protein, partial [Acidobacteriota bacterium]|nr:carboxypeptidase-like regulatory domain-containing protein [Acidobacteriota bacterium]
AETVNAPQPVTPGDDTSPNAVATPTPAASNVRGRVFYADTGRPVKRAPIMLMGEKGFSGGPRSMRSALTDNDGNFQLKGVEAGVYYAVINSPGVVSPMAFVDFSIVRGGREAEEFEKAAEGFEKIIVDGITDIDVQIPARRGGAISGRVMYDNGDPAIGVKVEILRRVNDKFILVVPNFAAIFSMMMGSGTYQTDDRGVYRLAGLPAGEYIVKVTESVSHGDGEKSYNEFEPIFGAGSGNSLLSIFYPDAFDSKSANVLNVELGQEMSEINLTIPSRNLYKIEGKIVSRKDKSPVKARIAIRREGEEEVHSIFRESAGHTSATDENGNWKFKEMPRGNYKLVIEPIQTESDYSEYHGDYPPSNMTTGSQQKNAPPLPKFAKKIQQISLEDKDVSEMVIELGYGGTIAGTVAVENNEKMPRVVTIVASNADSELTVFDTVLNYDGSEHSSMPIVEAPVHSGNISTIRSKPGGVNSDFEVENVSEGKTDILIHVGDENYYVKSAKAGGIDLLSGSRLEIKEGDAIRNVQIILSKNVGTLKGKLVDEKNEPLKNTQFTLVPTGAAHHVTSTYLRIVKTNANGEFETKLAPMEYAVVFAETGSLPKKSAEIDEWYEKAVKDAQKVTVEAGRTENLTVRKIKK